jgi:hypothetical protein
VTQLSDTAEVPVVVSVDQPPVPKPAETVEAKEPSVGEVAQGYRLGLLNAQAQPAKGPAENEDEVNYRVKNAPVDKLAALLVVLYPGEGPGGSATEQFILYKSAEIGRQARQLAERLDPGTFANSSGSAQTWKLAIEELYRTEFPLKLEPERRLTVVSLLHRVLNDEFADRDLRWSAGILASYLYTRYNPKDMLTARAALGFAGRLIKGDDYKTMVTKYHLIRLSELEGNKKQMKREALEALRAHKNLENTSCFQMIRELGQKK